jgi:hypothetical protein
LDNLVWSSQGSNTSTPLYQITNLMSCSLLHHGSYILSVERHLED